MSQNSKRVSKRYRQSSVITFLAIIAVLFICIVCVVRAGNLHMKSKELAETEKVMELKVEEAKQKQEQLKAQEEYMKSNSYIEDVAKSKLGLVYPDEIVIKPRN